MASCCNVHLGREQMAGQPQHNHVHTQPDDMRFGERLDNLQLA